MQLNTGEFMRCFLIHILPDGFHRIRHYGLLASSKRKSKWFFFLFISRFDYPDSILARRF